MFSEDERAYIYIYCHELKATLYPKFWWIVKELKEVFELEEF